MCTQTEICDEIREYMVDEVVNDFDVEDNRLSREAVYDLVNRYGKLWLDHFIATGACGHMARRL